MASIKEWYQFIIDEKQTLSSLDSLEPNPETTEAFVNDLKTTSKVAIWRLTAWVMAFLAFTLEQLWATKEEELLALRESIPPHTKSWWASRVKAFQYGDTTIIGEDGSVTYETIDESKQIVDRYFINGFDELDDPVAYIKAGKYDSATDTYVKLDTSEHSAFQSYINEITPMGVLSFVPNEDGGIITLTGNIWYDPEVLNSDLTRVDDPSLNVFNQAMDEYIENYVSKNSALHEHVMVDYLLSKEGIIDIELTAHEWQVTPLDSKVDVTQGSPTFRKYLQIFGYVGSVDTSSLTKVAL